MRLAIGLFVSVLLIIGESSAQQAAAQAAGRTVPSGSSQAFTICSRQNPQQGCTFACSDPNRPRERNCIQPPHPTFTPDPEYSEQARKNNIQGTVLLDILVNEKGEVADAKVARGLEPGLEQNSIATVRLWRFDPAKVEGSAVPVRLQVMMTFRLYSSPRRKP